VFKDGGIPPTGVVSVAEIVRRSSNVGVIEIAGSSTEQPDHYQRAFGFGTKTWIDFPAERPGS
jgi:cell division protein FtsI/penicillin-binding protein 2